MVLIPDEKRLEALIKDMPYFKATITEGFFSNDSSYDSFLYFKYDDSEIKGEMKLSHAYSSALMAECKLDKFYKLKDIKIRVYTPSRESKEIYAIAPITGMSSEEKLEIEKTFTEIAEKLSILLKNKSTNA